MGPAIVNGKLNAPNLESKFESEIAAFQQGGNGADIAKTLKKTVP